MRKGGKHGEKAKYLNKGEQMDLPIIDAKALFVDNDPREMENLRRGAEDVGFLIIRNSPFGKDALNILKPLYHRFFHLPLADKETVSMAKTGSNRGWGGAGSEQVNPDANPDYKEVFDLGTPDVDDPELAAMTYYAPNQWPEMMPMMRPVLETYYELAKDMSLNLLRLIAKATDLPGDFFSDKFSPPLALLRANYYPPRPNTAGEKDFGIAEHTDYGCLTLLLIDGVAGLEVKTHDGDWLAVDAKAGDFVINFGEMLESWSNGKIIATPHRVRGTNEERISVPFFFNPRFDTNVAPLGSGETLQAGDYLARRYDETYVHRQKAVM